HARSRVRVLGVGQRCRERPGSSRGRRGQPNRDRAAVIEEKEVEGLHGDDFTLPVTSRELLDDPRARNVIATETLHANGDLIDLLAALGIAGPYSVESPWELRDEAGRHLIHAGAYAAVPLGERFPPLLDFIRNYLDASSQLGFAQQSASEWRAALTENLVALLASVAPSHADSRVFLSNSGAEA